MLKSNDINILTLILMKERPILSNIRLLKALDYDHQVPKRAMILITIITFDRQQLQEIEILQMLKNRKLNIDLIYKLNKKLNERYMNKNFNVLTMMLKETQFQQILGDEEVQEHLFMMKKDEQLQTTKTLLKKFQPEETVMYSHNPLKLRKLISQKMQVGEVLNLKAGQNLKRDESKDNLKIGDLIFNIHFNLKMSKKENKKNRTEQQN